MQYDNNLRRSASRSYSILLKRKIALSEINLHEFVLIFVLCPSVHRTFKVTFISTLQLSSKVRRGVWLSACLSSSDHNLKVVYIYFNQGWRDFKIKSTENSRSGFNIRLRSISLMEVNRQICFHETMSSLVTHVFIT